MTIYHEPNHVWSTWPPPDFISDQYLSSFDTRTSMQLCSSLVCQTERVCGRRCWACFCLWLRERDRERDKEREGPSKYENIDGWEKTKPFAAEQYLQTSSWVKLARDFHNTYMIQIKMEFAIISTICKQLWRIDGMWHCRPDLKITLFMHSGTLVLFIFQTSVLHRNCDFPHHHTRDVSPYLLWIPVRLWQRHSVISIASSVLAEPHCIAGEIRLQRFPLRPDRGRLLLYTQRRWAARRHQAPQNVGLAARCSRAAWIW